MRFVDLAKALGVAFAIVAAGPAAAADQAPAAGGLDGWTMKGTVLLSRHGMRGPTKAIRCEGSDPSTCLDAIVQTHWPDLSVVAGHLTPQGYDRAVTMGGFYRSLYSHAGLLPEHGCPDPKSVEFVSDGVERTVMTAGAVMDGMFPGCDLKALAVHSKLYQGPSCGYDPKAAAAATLALVGGSWKTVIEGELAGPLAAMSKVLGPFTADGCKAHGATAPCSLATLPVSVTDPGAVSVASQPAEQFIMQYGAGLSGDQVAWGRLPEATGKPLPEALTFVNAIHALSDRAGHMPRYQAVKQGSAVLYPVLESLREVAEGHGPAFKFFSSHDNYILNVGGLLGLKWQLDSYQPYQIPPGGAVAFEVWQPPEGELAIRIVYYAQTIEQLHDNSPLSVAQPPASTVMPVEGCSVYANGACPWSTFRKIATGAIDMACVDPKRN